MKVEFKNYKVFINGLEKGYYSKGLLGYWIAIFGYNSLQYRRKATKRSWLKEMIESVVNE